MVQEEIAHIQSKTANTVCVNTTLRHKNKCIKVKGIVDTGNRLDTDAVISEQLAKKLGVRVYRRPGLMVGTAESGAKLRVVGMAEPLHMKLGGLGEVIVNPHVIADLSHPLNLGARFLHKREIHMEFKRNRAILRSKAGTEPLIAEITRSGQRREASDPGEEDQDETHEPATQEFCKLYKLSLIHI